MATRTYRHHRGRVQQTDNGGAGTVDQSGLGVGAIGVVNAAQSLAQQLNATTQGIQNLRANAEIGINDSINMANNALTQIALINNQLQNNGRTDASTASLLDQRDQYIDQMSQLMDIRVVTNNLNQVTLFTNSGVQLVGTEAARLTFNPQGTMTPNTLYDPNPTKSNVGTITIDFPHGGSYDMVSTNAIRSGKLAAYLELRDNTLVKAQTQIDQFAASMSSALSDKTTAGVAAPASVLPQAGFDLDLTGLQTGNVAHVTYKDNITGITHNLSIVRVDDPSVLPLTNNVTLDPNDEVLGIDFSGGMASVVTQLNAALGVSASLQFSNPSGSTLRVLDDGAPNRSDVTAASVTKTVSSLTGGSAQLPLFTDGGALYTGAITANGSQQTGLAGRISVNNALLGDPSRTIVYSTSPLTAAGDTTRSDFILDPADDRHLPVFAADRHRHHRDAVHRHAAEFRQTGDQRAGRGRELRQAAGRRAGGRSEHAAEQDERNVRASTSTTRWRICWHCRMPTRPTRA